MSQSGIQTPTLPAQAAGRQTARSAPNARWLSADILAPALVVVAFLLLEAFPIQAWLLTMGAYTGGGVSQAALPFWWTLALLVAFWLVGRIGRRWPFTVTLALAVVAGVIGFLFSLPLSPSAYATAGSSWPVALRDDVVTGATHLNDLLGLAVLIAWLCWRGVSRGARKGSYEALLRLFILGMIALVLAMFVAAALPAHVQTPLAADQTLLLLVEVFAGLVGLALAKMQALRERISIGGVTQVAAGYDRRWLLIALGLAGLLPVVALILGLFFSFDALSATFAQLGPFGAAITDAWNALINAIGAALTWLFNAIAALFGLHTAGAKPPSQNRPVGVQPNTHPQVGRSTANRTAAFTATVIVLLEGALITVVALAGLALMIYGLRALFFRARKPDPQQEADEERESLDASGLLGAQLRALFAGRRKAAAISEDPLPRMSMRWLYRETLRAGAGSATLARVTSETPDEYARRLDAALLGANGGQTELARDLAHVTAAYDVARYDNREPQDSQTVATLRWQAERIMQALRVQSRQNRQGQQRDRSRRKR